MKSVELAVVQFTPDFSKKSVNFDRITNLTANISADIVVLPELCTTGYFFQSPEEVARMAEPVDGETGKFFSDMARNIGAVVVAGFAEREKERLFNSCLIVSPDPRLPVRVYRKTHLFYKERFCFSPGDSGFFIVEDPVTGLRIGPMICYDWRFPESSRVLSLMGADLIVCPANLVTNAWRQVMPARAIENHVYLAVANRAGTECRGGEELLFKGNSAVYDYTGSELCRADTDRDQVLETTIYPEKTRDKSFNPLDDIFKDRRPGFYGRITEKL